VKNSKIILHFARLALPLTLGRKYFRSKEKIKIGFYFVLCSLIRTFAASIGSPEQVTKRESGENPEQSRCCELPLAV
jgi:hypothetical protein